MAVYCGGTAALIVPLLSAGRLSPRALVSVMLTERYCFDAIRPAIAGTLDAHIESAYPGLHAIFYRHGVTVPVIMRSDVSLLGMFDLLESMPALYTRKPGGRFRPRIRALFEGLVRPRGVSATRAGDTVAAGEDARVAAKRSRDSAVTSLRVLACIALYIVCTDCGTTKLMPWAMLAMMSYSLAHFDKLKASALFVDTVKSVRAVTHDNRTWLDAKGYAELRDLADRIARACRAA